MIDQGQFRQVLGHFPTGVTVVTGLVGDVPVGLTIGSFTSVSLDPALVGFLPMTTSDRWAEIRSTGAFCVNVLGAHQADLCWQFAKSSVVDPFSGVDWAAAPATGSPIIAGSLAWIDCTIHDVIEAGDHHMVLGAVRDLAHTEADAPDPLLFFRGKLGQFDPI